MNREALLRDVLEAALGRRSDTLRLSPLTQMRGGCIHQAATVKATALGLLVAIIEISAVV